MSNMNSYNLLVCPDLINTLIFIGNNNINMNTISSTFVLSINFVYTSFNKLPINKNNNRATNIYTDNNIIITTIITLDMWISTTITTIIYVVDNQFIATLISHILNIPLFTILSTDIINTGNYTTVIYTTNIRLLLSI